MSTVRNVWSVAPLGSVVLEMKGGASISAEDFTDVGVPVLHKGSIQPGGRLDFARDGKVHTSEEYVNANLGAVVDDRFVVATLRNLVRTGETLGFVAPIPEGHTFLLAQGAYGLKLDAAKLDSRYLSHLSNAWVFHREILRRMVGTTQVHIRNGDFLAVPIPLPPLPEQRRISEILDKADALRAKRRAALARLDTLNQSIFLDMFGDPTTNPKGWPEVTIADICEVKGGKRLPKGEEYSATPTPFRYIRVMDLRDGWVDESGLVYLKPQTQAQIARYVVNAGDVIISIAGSVGLVAPVSASLDGVNLTENAAKLVPRRGNIYEAAYLSAFLQTRHAQGQIGSHIGQVTIGKLALFRIEKIRVPMPPNDLQRSFIQRIAAAEAHGAAQQKAQAQLDALFATLQHRAFRGEL